MESTKITTKTNLNPNRTPKVNPKPAIDFILLVLLG